MAKSPPCGMTVDENRVLQLLNDAADAFRTLPIETTHGASDFEDAYRVLCRIVLVRPALRDLRERQIRG